MRQCLSTIIFQVIPMQVACQLLGGTNIAFARIMPNSNGTRFARLCKNDAKVIEFIEGRGVGDY